MHLAPRPFLLLLTVLLLAGPARAAPDDQRIAQLKEEIRTIESVAAETANAAEKPRLDRRLDILRQELAILEQRQSIEAQERSLQSGPLSSPRELLREKLRGIASDPAAAEARGRDLEARRTQAVADRDALQRQLDEGKPPAVADPATRRAELEQRLFNQNERLRALALQQEAAEYEADLVHQAQSLRERLRAADSVMRASLRSLFEGRLRLQGEPAAGGQLTARLANLDENLRNTQAAMDLAQQKLAKFDEEMQLLERQSNFLRRNPRAEQFLASERAQKQLLGERLPFLGDQVEALRKSRELLQTRSDLLALEARFLAQQFQELRNDYLAQLRWPALIAVLLLVAYEVASRVVLPRRYKKEELFLARRLGRYATALLILLVVAFSLIEDLSLLATTLGLVSAAVVISLQDVCASFCAWFVIMLGRKFTIGDRLEIDGTRGDVLDIQLLRTTLLEVNNWLGADQPTGRVLIIPNNFIFKFKVFNFSHGHPYIWGKVEVTVTYDTPVAGAMALFRRVLEAETRDDFAEARHAATEMERRYGVEDADYQPKIYTRIADSGVTFSLFYVCHYRKFSTVRNRLNHRLIAELETHPHIKLAYNTLHVVAAQAQTEGPSAVLGADATQAPFMGKPKG